MLCIFWLRNVLRATTAYTFSTSQFPKVLRTWGVFNFFTYKCVSRHNGAHFFDIATSKSGPSMVCFVYFDFEMCFAPQWHALFWHLNFQKYSECEVLLIFSTCKCASHHNGAHFFDVVTSKSDPSMVCFVYFGFEMCFAPQQHSFFWHFKVFRTCKCATRHNGVQFLSIFYLLSGQMAPHPPL